MDALCSKVKASSLSWPPHGSRFFPTHWLYSFWLGVGLLASAFASSPLPKSILVLATSWNFAPLPKFIGFSSNACTNLTHYAYPTHGHNLNFSSLFWPPVLPKWQTHPANAFVFFPIDRNVPVPTPSLQSNPLFSWGSWQGLLLRGSHRAHSYPPLLPCFFLLSLKTHGDNSLCTRPYRNEEEKVWVPCLQDST